MAMTSDHVSVVLVGTRYCPIHYFRIGISIVKENTVLAKVSSEDRLIDLGS